MRLRKHLKGLLSPALSSGGGEGGAVATENVLSKGPRLLPKAAECVRTAMRYVKDGERVFRFFIKSFFSGFLSVGSGF